MECVDGFVLAAFPNVQQALLWAVESKRQLLKQEWDQVYLVMQFNFSE